MTANPTFPKGRRLCAALLLSTILGGFATPAPGATPARLTGLDAPAAPASAPSRISVRLASAESDRSALGSIARGVGSLAVSGNQRLEPETILSYTSLRVGGTYDQDRLDQALRDLHRTELFADVAIAGADTGNLIIQVRENPVINRIVLEGNRRLKDRKLTPEIGLAPRQIFTPGGARADVARIIELYRRQGRYAASVEPQIVQLDQNRVDVVFAIDEGPRSRVRRINIIGNEHFGDRRLIGEMATRDHSRHDIYRLRDTYDSDRIAYDQQKLRQFYLAQGYADFRIVSAVAELTADRRDFIISYVVDEGPRYKFGDLAVDSDIRDFSTDSLEARLPMRSGQWYDARQVEAALTSLNDLTGQLGYAFADVQPQFHRDPAQRVMGVTFHVAETPRIYVERIDISGDATTRDKVIRREFRLAQGDPFNKVQIRRSRDRIQSLGFFQENLEVQEAQTSAPDRVLLGVDVGERATGELQLSAGFSSLESFLVEAAAEQRGFMGRGQEIRASANYSGYSRSIELGFSQPYRFDRNFAVGFDHARRSCRSFNFSGAGDPAAADQQTTTGGQNRMGVLPTDRVEFALRYGLNLDDWDVSAGMRDPGRERAGPRSGPSHVRDGGERIGSIGMSDVGPRISVRPVQTKASTGDVINRLDIFEDKSQAAAAAIGGRTYYFARPELDAPLGASARSLGLRPSIFADAGALWGIEDTAPAQNQSNSLVDSEGVAGQATVQLRTPSFGAAPQPRVSIGYAANWNSPAGAFRVNIHHALLAEPSGSGGRSVSEFGPGGGDEDEYDGPKHGRA